MAEFVGGEPISVGVNGPITFENKTDTAFDVGCGIVFRKSGLYRVSIVGRHMSVAVEPEIIYCKDCKHWQSEEHIGNNNVHTLNLASLPCKNWLTAGDWYCGSAERREK